MYVCVYTKHCSYYGTNFGGNHEIYTNFICSTLNNIHEFFNRVGQLKFS